MKVWNYMITMLVLMIFLNLIGLTTQKSDTGDLVSPIGVNITSTNSTIGMDDLSYNSNSEWYSKLFNGVAGLLFVATSIGAIIVGLYTKQFDWKLALLPFMTAFAAAFATMGYELFQLAKNTGETWLAGIVLTIFAPLSAMYIFSIVEWFGGTE